ncbi:MAG: hypothetical protein AMJ45_05190 [Syntrophobacter sp. DG_60]|nr:MAG: hypothetical protein AMJ45_05190 [Syntrophobacter sp. DG_60]
MYWEFYTFLRLKVFLRLLSFLLPLFYYSLAQTSLPDGGQAWHAITEFYRLYSRSITGAPQCSRKVAQGQAIPPIMEQSGAQF